MGFFSHQVDRSDIKAGDHIYTWRHGFLYSHHGIYLGKQKVVHFVGQVKAGFALGSGSGSGWNLFSSLNNCGCYWSKIVLGNSSVSYAMILCSSCSSSNRSRPASCIGFPECGFQQSGTGVSISCLNCFIDTGSLYRYQYGVWKLTYVSKLRGGTCTMAKSDLPEKVIFRTIQLLELGFGTYHVVLNNCEDFALYCKTGLMIRGKPTTGGSGQVNAVRNLPWKTIFYTAGFATIVSSFGAVPGGVAAIVKYSKNRYETDIGVRDDVEKVDVEEAAEYRNRDI